MKIRSLIRRFSFWQLFRLSGLMFQKPLLIFPTAKATKQTMIICNTLYGATHHNNGKPNAFRHALWNVLICQKTFRSTRNANKSMIWAQKVTDLHEKLAPNKPLEEAMDLHNNALGRDYFMKLKNASEEEIITFLEQRLCEAKVVETVKSVQENTSYLVYLSE
ncbi:DUF6973 domain-containing protein [Aquimarina sp. 2201CG14-23]|uniref:DUF6973 domain-containing protein n=1 Tax=Aquimarina mycalae TaxID=3040073 RepID=UPI0024782E12|nr:hypothetical protein [Aquimarina sp. 2201CG14-23]MDH7447285.1 hypothetical protein [Aquimarina sp. 2201CG14-23]